MPAAIQDFRAFIQKHFYVPVTLSVSESSTQILSVEKKLFSLRVRMHRAFLGAPEDVRQSVVSFLKKPLRENRRSIRDFFLNSCEASSLPRRRMRFSHAGKFYDLREIFDEVNREYFGGRIDALISFGRRPRRKRYVRHVSLGHYNWRSNIITVSRRLDRMDVPRCFVKFVVYHEMLHASDRQKLLAAGRKNYHGREFRREEKAFLEYGQITKIQREIIRNIC